MNTWSVTPWDAEVARLRAIKRRSFKEHLALVDLQGRVAGYLRAKVEQLEETIAQTEEGSR